MKMFIAFIFAVMQIIPAYAGVKTIVKSDIFEGAQTEPELLGNKGHFERNALSWAAYDDAAGTPVDGTGGSSTTTCARSTSSPIDGDGSLLMTKGAANYQGEGCALTFTIPANMSGDVLVGTFEYAVASGTFATDDVSVWAYNSTGASMAATSPSGLTNHALNRKTFKFQFTPAYSASAQTFRILLHIATTSASAYTLKFDNFQIHRKGKAAGLDTQVQYNSNGLLTGSTGLIYDYTNTRLGIGATPTSVFHSYNASNNTMFVSGDSAVSSYLARYSTDSSSPDYFFRKTRGSVGGGATQVQANDVIGRTLFQVYGGSNYRNIAYIQGAVDSYTSDTQIGARLQFYVSPSTAASAAEKMRLTEDGYLGIGTTSPIYVLDTYSTGPSRLGRNSNSTGAAATFYAYNDDTTANNWAALGFQSKDTGGTARTFAYIGAQFPSHTTGAATADLLFAVGASGTPNLTTALKLANNTYVTAIGMYNNTTASAANMYVDSSGLVHRSTSSKKYKTNIKDYVDGLKKANLLRPVTYTPKNGNKKTYAGFIAEEVHTSGLTEFVEYDKNNMPDALHYGQITALSIKAIQELSDKNDALEARVKVLEDKINKLVGK